MMKLDNFINMMTGHFNNKEQFDNDAERRENISLCRTH